MSYVEHGLIVGISLGVFLQILFQFATGEAKISLDKSALENFVTFFLEETYRAKAEVISGIVLNGVVLFERYMQRDRYAVIEMKCTHILNRDQSSFM